MTDRKAYQAEFRKRQREKRRELSETKPGQYIRDNPDYAIIMDAISEEQKQNKLRKENLGEKR